MRMINKLLIINIVLWILLAAFAFGAVFYLIDHLDTEKYTLSPAHIENIENVFGEIQDEIGIASNNSQISALMSSKSQALAEYDYRIVCFNSAKAVIYKGNISIKEAEALSEYARNNAAWVFDNKMVMYSAKIGNYYVIAVNNTHQIHSNIFLSYLWYPTGVVFLAALILILISIGEYYSIFPRLKKLKYAMHQVYCGNYSKVIESKRKSRDEICEIIIEFEMMRKQLSELSRAKAEFDRQRGETITGISHDLKTPLTVIQGYAKGLVDGVAARMGKTNEYATKIYEMVKSMNVLVNKLSDFSKPGNDDIIYTFIERDMVEIVKDFVGKYSIQYAAKGLNIKADYKSHKVLVYIDKEQFARVLQNILDNSVKYKVKSECHALITVYEENDNAVIIIADDGEGVEEYETEYIFESYYRGDPSRTNPISGSGLGLSIVKSVVTAHKGEVVAYNDNGLSIKISIPLRRSRK
ncbi:MAG: HAMP domain-containing histidine kinase [Clostridia bacterium]|nr:HAMP domain-containing histidine kinase [Clostridia bacterium]